MFPQFKSFEALQTVKSSIVLLCMIFKITGGPWLARIFGQRKTHASQIRASEVMY